MKEVLIMKIVDFFTDEIEKIEQNGKLLYDVPEAIVAIKQVNIGEKNIITILEENGIDIEQSIFCDSFGDYRYYGIGADDGSYSFEVYTKVDDVIFSVETKTEIFTKYAKYNNYANEYKTESLENGGTIITSFKIVFGERSIFVKEIKEGNDLIQSSFEINDQVLISLGYTLKYKNDPKLNELYSNIIEEIKPKFKEHLKAIMGNSRKMDLGEE